MDAQDFGNTVKAEEKTFGILSFCDAVRHERKCVVIGKHELAHRKIRAGNCAQGQYTLDGKFFSV